MSECECLTEALALVGGSINEHLGGDHISERKEHLHQLSIAKLLRQVVDEEVAAFGSWDGATCQVMDGSYREMYEEGSWKVMRIQVNIMIRYSAVQFMKL